MLRLFASTVILVGTASIAMAQPAKRDEAEKASDSGDKIICKRFVETGSLVKGYRTCKSKSDWERERDAVRASQNVSGACGNSGNGGNC